jgi:hypothetical protein
MNPELARRVAQMALEHDESTSNENYSSRALASESRSVQVGDA